jgi:cytochrome b
MMEQRSTRTVRIWDPLVRVGHWLLAFSVLAAWVTRHRPGPWHEWLGYAALMVVAIRCMWGWCGPQHARFEDFVQGPRITLRYARALLEQREPATVGHNPLGGWMVLALLLMVVLVAASGWLYTTDRYWGVEWVETLHLHLTNVLLVLIAMHVAGVAYASWRHQQNLIAAMLHGWKRIDVAEPAREKATMDARAAGSQLTPKS